MMIQGIFFKSDYIHYICAAYRDIYAASVDIEDPCPKVIKLVSCLTQLSTKIQQLIKTKIPNS